VLNYQTFHIIREYLILIWVLAGNVLLLLLYLGYKTNQRNIPFGYLFVCWHRVIGMSSVFNGMIIAEEVDGVRRQVGEEIPGGLTYRHT
jgi:uncharacterized integral membrane protein